jgi:hypothetical protein
MTAGEVMMRLVFGETMHGTWSESRAAGRQGRFDFTCEVETDDVATFLRTRGARITGTVTMEGVTDGAPLDGTMRIDPVPGREIVYDFTFRADGSRFRFLGRKDLRLRDLAWTLTTMKGQLPRDGVTVGDAVSRFRLHELPAFLGSFRLRA